MKVSEVEFLGTENPRVGSSILSLGTMIKTGTYVNCKTRFFLSFVRIFAQNQVIGVRISSLLLPKKILNR